MSQQYITIPIHKGCILVLTHQEYLRALKRGKLQRRREANDKRQQNEGSLAEALNTDRKKRDE